jgi:RHS repeat-associated protein
MHSAESALSCNKARYYNPQIGRFISEDPLFSIGTSGPGGTSVRYAGESFYTYVHNEPILLSDPSGMIADYNLPPGRPLCEYYHNCQPPHPRTCEDGCRNFLTTCYATAGFAGMGTRWVCRVTCTAFTKCPLFCNVTCTIVGAGVGQQLGVACYAGYMACLKKCKENPNCCPGL